MDNDWNNEEERDLFPDFENLKKELDEAEVQQKQELKKQEDKRYYHYRHHLASAHSHSHSHTGHHHGKNKKKKKALRVVLCVILAIILLLLGGAFIIFNNFYNKAYYENESDIKQNLPEEIDIETLSKKDEKRVKSGMDLQQSNAWNKLLGRFKRITRDSNGKIKIDDDDVDVYNLLVIGTDRRDKSWNGNSDTMMLVSINYNKRQTTLTSFQRDTAVNIPGYGVRKLNHAFAVGGGPLLVKTIENNFLVPIDNYVWIDFDEMTSVVDILGGVDVVITPAEGKNLGIDIAQDTKVHLNSEQALKYSRDRSSGGYDFGRTKRQRKVIMALVEKAKNGGFSNLIDTANAVLPFLNHNIERFTLLKLIRDLLKVKDYTFVEQYVPFDGTYGYVGEMMVPDYEKNTEKLYDSIY